MANEHDLCVYVDLGRVDPLNLSISVSGGKETNRDSHSSGERIGNSSSRSPLRKF